MGVYDLISDKLQEMTKSQKKIATYMLENRETVPFLTVGRLAKETGVSEATIVRFANFLGFNGFAEFQEASQDSIKRQLTTVEGLKMSDQLYEGEGRDYYELFQGEIYRIQAMLDQFDVSTFEKAVETIINGENIYIIANRSAVSLGLFLEFYLDLLLKNTELIRNPHGISEKMFRISPDDVVIGLSFPRYTKNTIEAVSFAKERGSKIVVMTDSVASPLVPYGDICLLAPSKMPSFIDSFVAPLSLINTLLVAVGKEKRKEIEDHLSNLEDVWARFQIFYQE